MGEVNLFSIKSFNELDEAHSHYGSLLYSNSTDLNVNLIFKNIFTETNRIMFDQISGNNDLAKLTHKINITMEYYSAIKRNSRLKLGGILPNEKMQSQKVTYCMIQFTQHFQNNQNTDMENRLVFVGREGCDYQGKHEGDFYGDGAVLYLDCCGGFRNLHR